MKRYVPDVLSLYRPLAAPVVAICIVTDHWTAVIILLLLGFVTDQADGPAARKWRPDQLREKFDVWCDRPLVVAPVVGMGLAGDISLVLVIPLVVAVFLGYVILPKQPTVADAVTWGASYGVAIWGMIHHVSAPWMVVGLVGLAAGLIVGAATHNHIERVQRELGD